MFQMPMSSPMMTTMLGFACAAAGPALQASATRMATKIPMALRMISSTLWMVVRP